MPSSSTTLLHPVLPPPLLCTWNYLNFKVASSPTVASLVVSFAHNQGKSICYVMFSHERGGLDFVQVLLCCSKISTAVAIVPCSSFQFRRKTYTLKMDISIVQAQTPIVESWSKRRGACRPRNLF